MVIALLEALGEQRGAGRVFYPLGLSYIAGYLKVFYPDLKIHILENFSELALIKPDIVGISSVSPAFSGATRLAIMIKEEFDIPVILGGPHISTLPGSLPAVFDAGVIGEGEETFLALISHFMQKGTLKKEEILNIPGLAVSLGDDVKITGKRPYIADIDIIPFPQREWSKENPLIQWVFSGRGCPFRCTFCSSPVIWKHHREHSPGYVASEIDYLVSRFNLSYCIFMDDLFAISLARVKAISDLVRKKPSRSLQYTATLRAELATKEMCEALKNLGVNYVHLGIESGSDRILKALKCGNASIRVNQEALNRCHDAGLKAIGSFIIGAPSEDEEDLEATYSFIQGNLRRGTLEGFSFSPLVPFPGTGIWQDLVKRGLINPFSFNWNILDIDIGNFNAGKYLLLTDRIDHVRFGYYFERFKSLFDGTLKSRHKDL